MNKIKWLGLLFVAGGLCLLGYQAIESIMAEGEVYRNYSLTDIFGIDVFAWAAGIRYDSIADGIEYVITMPAYLLSVIVGAFFLIISGIFAR